MSKTNWSPSIVSNENDRTVYLVDDPLILGSRFIGRNSGQPSDCMSEPQTSVKRVRWAQAWRGARPEQPVAAKVDP